MKIFLFLAAAAILIVFAMLYFGSGDLDLTAPKKQAAQGEATPVPQDFHAVTALLAQDLGSIPPSLDAPEVEPVNAFNVKSRLGGAAANRPEYQVLVQACDLIIYAAQEHAVRHRQDKEAEHNAPGGDLMATATTRQAAAANARTGIHARAQADWDGYRQQTDAEVKRLLGTLQNSRL